MNTRSRFRARLNAAAASTALVAMVAACASDETATTTAEYGSTEDAARLATGIDAEEIQRRVAQFAPVRLTFDESLLDANQRRVMKKLVEASDILDEIFRTQVWAGNPALAEALAVAEGAGMDAARTYFQIMYGPWDRLEEETPFLNVEGKPEGAGY